MKKIAFKPKPTAAKKADPVEDWVSSREVSDEEAEEMKRLTLDVPANLHKRIKAQCASRGQKMVEEIRELLEKHFPATS